MQTRGGSKVGHLGHPLRMELQEPFHDIKKLCMTTTSVKQQSRNQITNGVQHVNAILHHETSNGPWADSPEATFAPVCFNSQQVIQS